MNLIKTNSNPSFCFLLFISIIGLFPSVGFSQILSQTSIIAPNSPITQPNQLNVSPAIKADPKQEIWVSYNLLAITDQDSPKGEIVLESMPELVKTDLSESTISFNASDMSLGRTTGRFKQLFEQQAGNRSLKELNDTFGPDLAKAFLALKENKGSYLTQNIIRHFPVSENNDLRLLTSIEKVKGIQPALLVITIGQGDIPEEYKKNFMGETTSPLRNTKIIFILAILLIAGFVVFKKLNQ